jgi:hypothetical protein
MAGVYAAVSGLDDAETAALERALADQPARDVRQVLGACPPDVATAVALAGIEVDGVLGSRAPGAARETFDTNFLLHHVRNSALEKPERITRTRDGQRRRRSSLGASYPTVRHSVRRLSPKVSRLSATL